MHMYIKLTIYSSQVLVQSLYLLYIFIQKTKYNLGESSYNSSLQVHVFIQEAFQKTQTKGSCNRQCISVIRILAHRIKQFNQ